MRRVVVTGVGVVSPNGVGTKAFTQALREGISGMRFAALAGVECWIDAGLPWEMGLQSRAVDWGTSVLFGNGLGGMDTIAEKVVPLASTGQVRRLGSTAAEQIMSSNTSALLGGLLGV